MKIYPQMTQISADKIKNNLETNMGLVWQWLHGMT